MIIGKGDSLMRKMMFTAAFVLAAFPALLSGQIVGVPSTEAGFPTVFTLQSGNEADWDVLIVNKDGLPVSEPKAFCVDSNKKSCVVSHPNQVAVLVTAAELISGEGETKEPKLWSFSFINGKETTPKPNPKPEPEPQPDPEPEPDPEPKTLTAWTVKNVPPGDPVRAQAFLKAYTDTASALERGLIQTNTAAQGRVTKAVQPYSLGTTGKNWDQFRISLIGAVEQFSGKDQAGKDLASSFREIAAGLQQAITLETKETP